MKANLNYQVHPKEGMYFSFKILASIFLYALLLIILILGYTSEIYAKFIDIFVVYVLIIIILLVFRMGILVGYLKGNAIKVGEKQFPDIYEIANKQSQLLGLTKTPDIYILQAGGLLNAFATRFLGRNYIVIYSDILEEAYENNLQSVEFIIGHEFGHIKRKHLLKQILLFPSLIIPFLGSAYSRACEYTCDNIGAALSPKGVKSGLILLASGKKLYHHVNIDKFVEQKDTEAGFWSWIAEKISSHPKLTKRVAVFQSTEFSPAITETRRIVKEFVTEDHNKYKPGF
jgi:Zn-dependent protease with chaperone function